jgi:hypothetical protein
VQVAILGNWISRLIAAHGAGGQSPLSATGNKESSQVAASSFAAAQRLVGRVRFAVFSNKNFDEIVDSLVERHQEIRSTAVSGLTPVVLVAED